MKKITNIILWIIYVFLLVAVLGHTAWAFGTFEDETTSKVIAGIPIMGWVTAVAFEGAIAAFTFKLAEHISGTANYKNAVKRFAERYLNEYSLGLLLVTMVSGLANWSHAVEFANDLGVFSATSASKQFYSVAFGGILPVASFLFASVLSKYAGISEERDEEKEALKKDMSRLRRELGQANNDLKKFGEYSGLFSENMKERIETALKLWPDVSSTAICGITGASASYVSEVKNNQPSVRSASSDGRNQPASAGEGRE